MFTIKGKFTTATVTIDDVDEGTINQIRDMCNHPACANPIVVMPDTHLGKGCVIGFTMLIGDKIVPNYVGVDIGCSMQSVEFDVPAKKFFSDEKDMQEFDRNIRQKIPMGFNIHRDTCKVFKNPTFYNELNNNLRRFHINYVNRYGVENSLMLKSIGSLQDFEKFISKFGGKPERILCSLGTLGGGNHFIECSEGGSGNLWITTHSGSRNLGKVVCDYHQDKAWKIVQDRKIRGKHEYISNLKEQIERGEFDKSYLKQAIEDYDRNYQVGGITRIDAFLQGLDLYEYLYDMVVSQTYAEWNHVYMHETIKDIVGKDVLKTVKTTHNYIDFCDFIIRKGAIRSYKSQPMIIPFNSRDGILICAGKSNPDWNYSAPHGAGRILSRSEANRQITAERAKEIMSTVYASETPVDESPLCYKDAGMIEEAIEPTALIIDRLKPIVNFKAE